MARKNKETKVKPADRKKTVESRAARIIGNPVRVLLIMAFISLLLGVALVRFYVSYYDYFDFIVGGIIALIGIINIIFYFCKKTVDGVFRSEFAIGIFCIGVGTYIALNGGVSFSFLVVIGALLTLDGIIKLQYTLDLVRMRFKKWWLVLIFSLLGIVLGVVLLMDLLKDIFDSDSITYTGLLVCFNALLDIIVAIIVGIRNRRSLKAAAEAPVVLNAPAVEETEPALEPEPEEEQLSEEAPDAVVELPGTEQTEEAASAEEPAEAEEPEAELAESAEEPEEVTADAEEPVPDADETPLAD